MQNKENDPAAADAFFQKALKFGDVAAEQYPGMYRPAKLKGDVAMQKGQNEEAIQYYIQSIDLLEKMDDTSRFAGDAKNLYNAVGNAYLDKKDKETAKRYFNGYLKYDPDNADYRKFVESL